MTKAATFKGRWRIGEMAARLAEFAFGCVTGGPALSQDFLRR